MKSIAMIPARYEATRFKGKLMAELKGKTVIRHTYDATAATGLFDDVVVVTDSDIIYKVTGLVLLRGYGMTLRLKNKAF